MAEQTWLGSILEFFIQRPWLLGLMFLLYCVIWYISIKINGRRPGPNPFKFDYRRKPEPLVTDKAARKARLKQVFALKKVPEKLDAVVIGSGVSGLTCAGLLARAGRRVLVLEQHSRAGGACHTFKEQGFEFDVGIHYVGGMNNASLHKVLLDQLSCGQLQFASMPNDYDQVVLGRGSEERRYTVCAGQDQFRRTLLKYFPEEQKAIDAHIKNLERFNKSFIGFFLTKVIPLFIVKILLKTQLFRLISNCFYAGAEPADSYYRRLTKNKDLRAVLQHNYGDVGTIPDDLPVIVQTSLDNHFMSGAAYPMGGASEVPYHFIPTIERAGGRVLVKAPVQSILLGAKNEAVGVRISKGGETCDIHAPLVISSCGVYNTFNRLLPQEVALNTELGRLLNQKHIEPGLAAVSLFVGLDGSTEELGVTAHNYWIYKGSELTADTRHFFTLSAADAVEADFPFIFAAFPSAKDPSHAQHSPGKTTCTVIAPVNYEWFKEWKEGRVKHRGAPYENLKDAMTQNIWGRICELFPQLKDKVVYMELGSPLSNNFYLGAGQGEIYGLDHSRNRFDSQVQPLLRPESGIPGLYLTGQDILLAGFVGGVYAGLLTTSVILNRNLITDLGKLRKKHYPRPEHKKQNGSATNGVVTNGKAANGHMTNGVHKKTE